jgi:hypothetical protein
MKLMWLCLRLMEKGALPVVKTDVHNGTDHVAPIGDGTVIAYIAQGVSPFNPAASMGFDINQQGGTGMGTMPSAMGRTDMNQRNQMTQTMAEKQRLAQAMGALDKLPKLNASRRIRPNYSARWPIIDGNIQPGDSLQYKSSIQEKLPSFGDVWNRISHYGAVIALLGVARNTGALKIITNSQPEDATND